jgi:serine/threonine protein kinase
LLRGASTLKIADLGLVRTIKNDETEISDDDENKDSKPWTEYVSTRWYRAPEVLLRSPIYGAPVDIFALGAVAAELYSLRPLFPGTSEPDQLACIASVLGYPTEKTWPEGVKLAARLGFAFPENDTSVDMHTVAVNNMKELLPEASFEAIDVMARMCCWDPEKRWTAEQALKHPYFTGIGVNGSGSVRGGIYGTNMSVGDKAMKRVGPPPPLATPQAAAVTAQLLQAAARIGRRQDSENNNGEANKESDETPALKRLAQRAAKRQRATLRRRKTAGHHAPPAKKERKQPLLA